MADEIFKGTLMGGFDKEDVLNKVQIMKEEAYAEKTKLIKAGKEKDEKIEELIKRLELKEVQKEQALEELRQEHKKEMDQVQEALRLKEEQKDRLERQIQEKYQKYIDRYDLIGNLVLDAQIRAEEILSDAEAKRNQILTDAQEEADRRLTKVQMEVDEKLAEGKRKYIAVQEEMNEIIELINQAQKRFMASYKEVHRIISTMPESMSDLEDDAVEFSGVENAATLVEEPVVEVSSVVVDVNEEDDLDDAFDSLDEVDEEFESEIYSIIQRDE